MAGKESGPGKDTASEGTRRSPETSPRPSLDPTATGVREEEPYEEESGVVCGAGSATVASHVDIPASSIIAHRLTSAQGEQKASTQTMEFRCSPPVQSAMPTPGWQVEVQPPPQGHSRVPPPLPTLHLPLPSEISLEQGFPELESPSSGHFSVSPSEQSLLSPTFPVSPIGAYAGTLSHHRLPSGSSHMPSPPTRSLSSISEVESAGIQPSSAGLLTPAWSPSWPYTLSSPPSAAASGRLPSWSSEEASPLPTPYQLRTPRTPRTPRSAGTPQSFAASFPPQARRSTTGRKARGVRSRRQYQRRRGSVSSELSSTEESLVSQVSGTLFPHSIGVKRREKLSSKRKPDPEPTETDRPERRSVYMMEHDEVDSSLLRELFERGEREQNLPPALQNFVIKVISGCLRDEQDVPSYVRLIDIKKEVPHVTYEVAVEEVSVCQPSSTPRPVTETEAAGSSVEPLPFTSPVETTPHTAVLAPEEEGPEVTVAPQRPAAEGGAQPYMYLIAPGSPNFPVTIDDIVRAEKCGCDRCDPDSSRGEHGEPGAALGSVEASRAWQVVPPDAVEECTIVLPMQQDIPGKTRYYLIPMSYKQTGHARDCHQFLMTAINHPAAGQGTRELVSSFWRGSAEVTANVLAQQLVTSGIVYSQPGNESREIGKLTHCLEINSPTNDDLRRNAYSEKRLQRDGKWFQRGVKGKAYNTTCCPSLNYDQDRHRPFPSTTPSVPYNETPRVTFVDPIASYPLSPARRVRMTTLVLCVLVAVLAGAQAFQPDRRYLQADTGELQQMMAKFAEELEGMKKTMATVLGSLAGNVNSVGNLPRNKRQLPVENGDLNGPPGEKGETGADGNGGSSVYIRWGRTTCPNDIDTSLIYDGIAGGTHFTNTGGGANYVCLPKDPEWGVFTDGYQGGAYMQGAEYELNFVNPFPGASLHDHDVPCAVCHVASRGSKLMIPARLSCPSGWTREYNGYLMTEYYAHKRSEFVCMDGEPETRPGGHVNHNGALFYPVEANCGSLPCPNYVQGRELTCVVCTK
ncbi:hypothetical protein Bbelb_005190 [Branchiostoma belcheri]|nr:hypothetical protein Bbelb_005190 [Branchiostoma belcheri]